MPIGSGEPPDRRDPEYCRKSTTTHAPHKMNLFYSARGLWQIEYRITNKEFRMMIFSFDIQYSLIDILQLKELPRPLNSIMNRDNSGMNYQQRNRALFDCIREPCE